MKRKEKRENELVNYAFVITGFPLKIIVFRGALRE
jgi:hypothetical protein